MTKNHKFFVICENLGVNHKLKWRQNYKNKCFYKKIIIENRKGDVEIVENRKKKNLIILIDFDQNSPKH